MAKSSNQKLKILYLMKGLLEKTDENHPMSMSDILKYLKGFGIEAERKSIYDDIEALRVYGLDIVAKKERPSGYYIGERQFELPELKLLVDAVQSSKFMTTKKSGELIKKLEKLCSTNQAKSLQRQVYVANRIKTMNESIYYNVDDIHMAISENKKITFQYCEWSTEKKLIPKKNGRLYNVSPWVLTWEDENYYLIAFDNTSRTVKHYRVDKIKKINLIDEDREGKEYFTKFDTADFSKKTFGMFGGKEQDITLKCKNKMIGVILDRFGKDIFVAAESGGSFKVRVKVNVSPQFYGWITGIGEGITITEPESAAKEYKKYLKGILKNYHDI